MPRKKLDPITRKERLENDGYECQFAKLFGIVELSGVKCVKRLEVHHISYRNAGKETNGDLITVCVRCHDFITGYVRALRYSRRAHRPQSIEINNVEGKAKRKIRNEHRITKDQI